MRYQLTIAGIMTLISITGCGSYEPAMPPTPATTPAESNQAGQPGNTSAAPAETNPVPTQPDQTVGQPALSPPANQAAAPPAEQPDRVKAEVGVAKRGRGYGGGIITEPIRARFRVEEGLRFNVQIKQAMDLYKATNEHYPKTHNEFMEQIVKANNIPLPELPPGEQYVYDPATAELMVARPAPAQTQPQQ